MFYPANGFHHGNPAGNAAELDASFQYRVLPCVLEAAVLIPVVRNPNAGALRDDTIWQLGVRFNF